MLDHISIGVRDVAKAKAFYDAAMKPLGYKALHAGDTYAGYGKDDVAEYWIQASAKPVPPDMESGLHFCFKAPDAEAVDAFYKAALKAGGKDNGKPGLRADSGDNYYAAFVVDPDGYRLEAYCGAKT